MLNGMLFVPISHLHQLLGEYSILSRIYMTTPPPNVFLSLRHTVYPAIRISLSEIELSSFDLLIARISRALCARKYPNFINMFDQTINIKISYNWNGITFPLVIPDSELHPNMGIFNVLINNFRCACYIREGMLDAFDKRFWLFANQISFNMHTSYTWSEIGVYSFQRQLHSIYNGFLEYAISFNYNKLFKM